MAKRIPETTRTLRTRNANGTAKTARTSETTASTATDKAETVRSKKAKTTGSAAGPKRASTKKTTAAVKTKGSKSGKATQKSVGKKATAKKSPSKLSGVAAKIAEEVRKKAEDRRKWLVWPPYAFVSDIPKEHVDKYKAMIQGPPPLSSVKLRSCVPGTTSGYKRAESMNGLDQVIAYRALYQVVEKNSKAHEARLKCIEPGWEDVHSGGQEVDVKLTEGMMRVVLSKQDRVMMGWVLTNDGEGYYGKSDGSGKAEANPRLSEDEILTASANVGMPHRLS